MQRASSFITRLAMAMASVMVLAIAAFAQAPPITTGTGTLSGTVSPAVQLVSNGNGSIAGNNGGSAATGTQNTAISATINFGELSPNNTTAAPYVSATLPLQLRSNCSFNLLLARGAATNLPDGVQNSGTLQTGDIGIALDQFAPASGVGLVINGAAAQQTAAGLFYIPNFPSGITPVNGGSNWTKSLHDAGTSTATAAHLISTGPRISNGGDNSSSNNFL